MPPKEIFWGNDLSPAPCNRSGMSFEPDEKVEPFPGQRPEFLRLPPPRARCPVTGLSRGALNGLILPSPANNFKPPVRSFVLRQRGARTGIRLIDYHSLRNHILANEASNNHD